MQTVKTNKILYIEPHDEPTEYDYVMDVKELAKQVAPSLPKPEKNGKICLVPDSIVPIRRKMIEAKKQEKERIAALPQLEVDIESKTVALNGKMLDLNPEHDDISNDINLFISYMNGFERFYGDTKLTPRRYYEYANWFFVSPFLAQMRYIADRHGKSVGMYPVFGLLYGRSKAGKTTFMETLLRMMIGSKPTIDASEFTQTNIAKLKYAVKGVPIIVDDLDKKKFDSHAIPIIKVDKFGVKDKLIHYPAVAISANEDVKAVAQEIIRRTVICRSTIGLTNIKTMNNNFANNIQKKMGIAFYCEYLRRMLEIVPDMLEELANDENIESPDIIAASSNIIYEIAVEYADNELPEYIRKLTLEDYFGENVTASNAKNIVCTAWKGSRKVFAIDKKEGLLKYVAGEKSWEADRIVKELPEYLEAQNVGGTIFMNLEEACKFFEIDFRKNRFWMK
jgi:hypothetical protein